MLKGFTFLIISFFLSFGVLLPTLYHQPLLFTLLLLALIGLIINRSKHRFRDLIILLVIATFLLIVNLGLARRVFGFEILHELLILGVSPWLFFIYTNAIDRLHLCNIIPNEKIPFTALFIHLLVPKIADCGEMIFFGYLSHKSDKRKKCAASIIFSNFGFVDFIPTWLFKLFEVLTDLYEAIYLRSVTLDKFLMTSKESESNDK